MLLIYVSGAMTPTKENPDGQANIQRLFDASKRLFMAGYAVYCPYESWFNEDEEITNQLTCNPYGEMYRKVIKMDLCILSRCDAIYMTKGWEHSRGAQLELATAQNLGKEVWYEKDAGP